MLFLLHDNTSGGFDCPRMLFELSSNCEVFYNRFCILVGVSIADIKSQDQSNLGRKGLMVL